MKSKYILITSAVLLMAAGCNMGSDGQQTLQSPVTIPTNTVGEQKNNTESERPAAARSYQDYSPQAVQTELAAGKKVVLFFHAPWCPYCKTANTAFSTNPGQIPDGVVVFKTDYDSNSSLKEKYAVTYQHTFVQLDASQNAVTKWNGGDIEALIKNIK